MCIYIYGSLCTYHYRIWFICVWRHVIALFLDNANVYKVLSLQRFISSARYVETLQLKSFIKKVILIEIKINILIMFIQVDSCCFYLLKIIHVYPRKCLLMLVHENSCWFMFIYVSLCWFMFIRVSLCWVLFRHVCSWKFMFIHKNSCLVMKIYETLFFFLIHKNSWLFVSIHVYLCWSMFIHAPSCWFIFLFTYFGRFCSLFFIHAALSFVIHLLS